MQLLSTRLTTPLCWQLWNCIRACFGHRLHLYGVWMFFALSFIPNLPIPKNFISFFALQMNAMCSPWNYTSLQMEATRDEQQREPVHLPTRISSRCWCMSWRPLRDHNTCSWQAHMIIHCPHQKQGVGERGTSVSTARYFIEASLSY